MQSFKPCPWMASKKKNTTCTFRAWTLVSTYSNKPYIHPLLWAHPQFQTYHLVPSKKTILSTKTSLNIIHWNMFPLQYANRYGCWWSTPPKGSPIDILGFFHEIPKHCDRNETKTPRNNAWDSSQLQQRPNMLRVAAWRPWLWRFMEIQAAKAVSCCPLIFKWFKGGNILL